MSYDWSGRRTQRFQFWSSGELTRVGVILGVAMVPLSMGPGHSRSDAPAITPAVAASQPGRLRLVRITPFDMNKLGLSAMGDEPVR